MSIPWRYRLMWAAQLSDRFGAIGAIIENLVQLEALKRDFMLCLLVLQHPLFPQQHYRERVVDD